MKKNLIHALCLSFLFVQFLSASDRVTLSIQRVSTSKSIQLDGIIQPDEYASTFTNSTFTTYSPSAGDVSAYTTKLYLAYSDEAIYIGAELLSEERIDILRELSPRDEIGDTNTDWFGVLLDPYNKGNNGYGFWVSAAGIQSDLKYDYANGGNSNSIVFAGDESWNEIWESKVSIQDHGWTVEMRIPFAALRFPTNSNAPWGINFGRQVRKSRELSFLHPVDRQKSGLINQTGILEGISNLAPPLRISGTPYASISLNKMDQQYKTQWNAGLDVKWGINEAFTLDATLIPDFNNALSDNTFLNLSPFEVKLDENRYFFTEGTELFNRGEYFYSRRIGGAPFALEKLNEIPAHHEILNYPLNNRLLNAIKLSGRTKGGTGIGFFNALENRSYAHIRNMETLEEYRLEVNPLTNYSALVIDQYLPNSSSIAFINTYTARQGGAVDGLLNGVDLSINDHSQTYRVEGRFGLSQRFQPGAVTERGFNAWLWLNKISGTWRWFLGNTVESNHYNPNDLGFLYSPNERTYAGELSYNVERIAGPFQRQRYAINMEVSTLYSPATFTSSQLKWNAFAVTKDFLGMGWNGFIAPWEGRDIYEPRVAGRYVYEPRQFKTGGFFSTDYRKRLALDVFSGILWFDEDGRYVYDISIAPRVRVNDHLRFIWTTYYNKYSNNRGFSSIQNDSILFARRNWVTIQNELTARYIFNRNLGIDLRARHLVEQIRNNAIMHLQDNGSLTYFKPDQSLLIFNGWNMDINLTWRFAPGSDLIFTWKQVFQNEGNVDQTYLNSFNDLFQKPLNNTFVIKALYYLDFNKLRTSKLP